MTRTIVFHSYKGGTGKTTIAANVAAYFVKKGYRVVLLDLDVYAPSLYTYFETEPSYWINDFLLEQAEVKDVIVDRTFSIPNEISVTNGISNLADKMEVGKGINVNPYDKSKSQLPNSASTTTTVKTASGLSNENPENGMLWVVFANPQREAIYKLEGGKQERVQLLRRFIAFREEIFTKLDIDYLIIDTSPGIRYWSLNALAVADILYLTLKAGDLDVAGTKRMATDIYSTFTKFGAKPYLLLNKVAGYCIPRTMLLHESSLHLDNNIEKGHEQNEMTDLSKHVGIDVISALPCYCDIQFSKKEFLTALIQPDHPFSKKIQDLAIQIQKIELNRKM